MVVSVFLFFREEKNAKSNLPVSQFRPKGVSSTNPLCENAVDRFIPSVHCRRGAGSLVP